MTTFNTGNSKYKTENVVVNLSKLSSFILITGTKLKAYVDHVQAANFNKPGSYSDNK